MKTRYLFRLILLALLIIITGCFSASCSFFEDNTVVLWTDKAEIAPYVELFNAEHQDIRVEIVYRENPAQSLLLEDKHPHMVIGERLISHTVFEQLKPVTYLFEDERLNKDIFYTQLLERGFEEQEQYLLPISFTIPALMFKPANITKTLDNFFITFEDLKEEGKTFNKQQDSEFVRLGFSPDWSTEFLYLTAALFDTNFRENSVGNLVWNQENLTASVEFVKEWIEQANGSRQDVEAFIDKYMYNPDYKLINNDRILFSFTSIRDFLSISDEDRANLGFRWIAKEEKIRAGDDMLYLAVPKNPGKQDVVESFILWFFDSETQARLLETQQYKRIRTFGIADGFSSIIEVNERHFPRFYPPLSGHIAQEQYLHFPSPLPLEWPQIKNEVLKPWLRETVHGETTASFGNVLQSWEMQKPTS